MAHYEHGLDEIQASPIAVLMLVFYLPTVGEVSSGGADERLPHLTSHPTHALHLPTPPNNQRVQSNQIS
jgi:hypothetical protein